MSVPDSSLACSDHSEADNYDSGNEESDSLHHPNCIDHCNPSTCQGNDDPSTINIEASDPNIPLRLPYDHGELCFKCCAASNAGELCFIHSRENWSTRNYQIGEAENDSTQNCRCRPVSNARYTCSKRAQKTMRVISTSGLVSSMKIDSTKNYSDGCAKPSQMR